MCELTDENTRSMKTGATGVARSHAHFVPSDARGSSGARKLACVAAALVALSLAPACAIIPYSADTISLKVQGNVPDAQVTIDDMPIGALGYVAAHGVALPPGKHRVTVERAGYFPWDAVLEANDEPIHLDVKLVPIPD